VVDTVQHDLIATHGGLPGLRDEQLLESALARPKQIWSYADEVDIPSLAAGYGFALAKNHPYNDGNKRIAFVVMAVFAELNGFELDAPEQDVVEQMLRLAAGSLDEEGLADWLRQRLAHNPRACDLRFYARPVRVGLMRLLGGYQHRRMA
jgi:death-on-curing protein